MKFEHLIEINDPANPLLGRLTRAQLWRGLVMRAQDPQPFMLGLDDCRILDRSADGIVRELHFGQVVIRDRVKFEHGQRVRYLTEAPSELAGASLVMTIEEPGPQQLFVRFEYCNDASGQAEAAEPFYDDIRRSAYTKADIDTIRGIRLYASEGLLDIATA